MTNSSPCLLSFAIHLSVPWILAQTFQTESIEHIHWLVREFNIKWWANFKLERDDISAVHRWMASVPRQVSSTPSQTDFKAKKARLQMALASAATEEEFQKIIAELQDFNSTSNTEKVMTTLPIQTIKKTLIFKRISFLNSTSRLKTFCQFVIMQIPLIFMLYRTMSHLEFCNNVVH